MDQKNKLERLDTMTQESLNSRPNDSIKALAEYFKNYHEKLETDIDYSTVSQKDVKRVLSYKLKSEEIIEEYGDNLEQTFTHLDEEEKIFALSLLLDAQLKNIVSSSDAKEVEELFSVNLVPLNKKIHTLCKKITNEKVKMQFRVAITQTSLMVFIAAYKSTQPEVEIEFDKYIREFLFFSKDDDKDIYRMKQFYLNEINAETLGIGYVPEEETSPAEAELIAKEVQRSRDEFDELLRVLKEKYSTSKLHLMS